MAKWVNLQAWSRILLSQWSGNTTRSSGHLASTYTEQKQAPLGRQRSEPHLTPSPDWLKSLTALPPPSVLTQLSSALPPSWKFSLASAPHTGLVASYYHTRPVSISPPAIRSLVQSSLQLFLHSLLTLFYLIILPTVWSKDVITTAAVLSHRNYFFTGKSAKIQLLALDTVA